MPIKTKLLADGTKVTTVKEETYLKNRSKYDQKSKSQIVMIHCKDGTRYELPDYNALPIIVEAKAYFSNTKKYDSITDKQVIIVFKNGTKVERDAYKQNKRDQKANPQLPGSDFAQIRLTDKKIKRHFITEDDKCNYNRCDMLHLLVWWDQSLLEKKDGLVVLKSNQNCYVVREGIFNIETCELAPAFIALQKYLDLNMLQAYYVCDSFLKHADKKSVRNYSTLNYGLGKMPTVAPDALNYILDDSILYVEDVALATLYGVLKDVFHISKSVIYEMIERKYIVVDSHYNICFLSYDESGNVSSIYKMSRYNHSDTEFSFNRYVTKSDVSFMYCSEEAKQNNSFGSVVVFDSPIELMSYLTLEESNHNIVPLMDESCCYIAMFNSNILSIKECLKKHNDVKTLYIAIRLTALNGNYIKKHLSDYAKKLRVPETEELNDIIFKHTQRMPTQYINNSFRLDGWNALLRLYSDMFSIMF